MKCDVCGNKNSYIKDHEHVFTIKGKELKFTSPRRFCSKCDNLVYDADLDNNASLKAIEEYNKLYGIPKESIVELRNHLNLSQELFSKIIGCAKKTLVSYEKGASLPNDNYLIIIKSLLAKPETIVTLVTANKKQFTDKEYNKIQNKLEDYLGNNIKNLFYEENFMPTEFNGYTKLDKNKIFNMILIFSDSCVLKTKLLKEMFYADFLFYKNTGASITGLEYAKLPYGPVPDNFEKIIKECLEQEIIDYQVTYDKDYEYHNIKSKKDIDFNVFSKDELDVIKKVKSFFESYSSSKIVNFSHQEKAFTETEMNKKISYDFAFDINI